jgi:NodT family efflux transporter outer membrane factor (OMF) lipoprotein
MKNSQQSNGVAAFGRKPVNAALCRAPLRLIHNFYILILNFAFLLLLAGCNLAPGYHQPSVQTPPAFKETNAWKLAQPSDGVIKGKWWEMFNDAQLNALEEQVAISNQNIAAALQNFFAARALVKEARSAYYPTVGVAPAVAKSQSGAHASAMGNNSTISLPADASWEPDLWDAVRNTVRANAYAAQASAAILENMKLTAQADLAVDYYELRGQDEMIQLFKDTVKAYKDSLDLTTTLYQTGIDSELNEAQADALLETTLAQASGLAIQRAQYEHAIALLVGQPASTFSLNAAPISNQPPVVPVGLPSTLLERRPDVASAERTVAEANAQIGVARAAWFPTLSLSGSAGYESTSLSSLLSPPSFFWSVGASLTETIFDAGKRKAANEQAWANYRSMAANYRQTVLTAFQQVEDNLAALRVLSSEIQQQSVAIKASQKSFDLSMEQYRLGIASYLNVISAQETLLGNQQTAVTLQMQQMVDTVQLIMALGGGWNTSDLPSSRKLVLKSSPVGK